MLHAPDTREQVDFVFYESLSIQIMEPMYAQVQEQRWHQKELSLGGCFHAAKCNVSQEAVPKDHDQECHH